MKYLLILIIILTLTGEVMAGPKYKKKLGDRHPSVKVKNFSNSEKETKKSFWDAIKESYDPSPFRKIKIRIK